MQKMRTTSSTGKRGPGSPVGRTKVNTRSAAGRKNRTKGTAAYGRPASKRKRVSSRRTALRTAQDPGRRAAKRRDRGAVSPAAMQAPDRKQNTFSMFLASLVILILLVAVSVNGVSLTKRLRENKARTLELQQEIRSEEQRAKDIEEYRRYTSTDAYIEEVAREKLGLIYEGETVFKEEK
ncbi:MAG: septum formation initiator family protein [Sarcina sp.]|nr:septum formation initiator family protein [Sarcina sp.]